MLDAHLVNGSQLRSCDCRSSSALWAVLRQPRPYRQGVDGGQYILQAAVSTHPPLETFCDRTVFHFHIIWHLLTWGASNKRIWQIQIVFIQYQHIDKKRSPVKKICTRVIHLKSPDHWRLVSALVRAKCVFLRAHQAFDFPAMANLRRPYKVKS